MRKKTSVAPTPGEEPVVLRFTAKIQQEREGTKAVRHFLELPVQVSCQLQGMSRLEGIINEQPFRAALERPAEGCAEGKARLAINAAMLKGAKAQAGETVHMAVLGPEAAPEQPSDMAEVMTEPARAQWDTLTDGVRRDWIRWINATNNPATRARRITRTVEQLAEGKRRPCCVNMYEYMLQRVKK